LEGWKRDKTKGKSRNEGGNGREKKNLTVDLNLTIVKGL